MEQQQRAVYDMAYLGLGLGIVGVFFLTGVVPVVQAAQTLVTHMLQAMGV